MFGWDALLRVHRADPANPLAVDPETLPAEDYLLRYASAAEGLIPDGTPFAKVKEMLHLRPGDAPPPPGRGPP